jgi:Domain of unknown function (DUF4389)
VAEHPVRVTVTDNLERSRLTILFRLLLAIPHFVWFWLWTIAAVLAAIANWFVTLAMGRSPSALHRFLTAYLRYWVHLFAYVFLAANPYPGFTGTPGYPVDAEFGEAREQRRVVTALRIFLLVPALILAAAFESSGLGYWATDDKTTTVAGPTGTLLTVAFFGWFASLATGRMPLGFRDLQAYGLRYLAQVGAYALIVTDRFPNVDPAEPLPARPEHPVRLTVEDDLRRSRLTVFFRLLLALPHFVWLVLWAIVAFFAAVANWAATLVVGRPPLALHRFLSAFVRYSTHVSAYASLAANPFPGFTGAPGRYPVDPVLPPPAPQSRLVTLFRIFLAIPALAVSSALGILLVAAAFLGWFASLALGRMPRSLREAQAYDLRYSAQVSSYLLLVTERYPYSGPAVKAPEPPAAAPPPEPPPAEAPAPV